MGFNYFNATANYANMPNITPSFYTLEMVNMTIANITNMVSAYINSIKR